MADFLFADTKPSTAVKRTGEGKTHSEPKRAKPDLSSKSSSKPHKHLDTHHKSLNPPHKPLDAPHKPHSVPHKSTPSKHTSNNDVKKTHSSSGSVKKTQPHQAVKVKRPVISDSDDEDGIDGNLFSRKKAPEPIRKPHPPPQVKAEVKREVQLGEGKPPTAAPAKEKMPKSDGGAVHKQELKVVVKRVHMSSNKPTPTPPKSEPMDTPAAPQPPMAKAKQQAPPQPSPSLTAAGKKRPHVVAAEKEEEEEESSSSEEEEDEEDDSDSSFDEEPTAQGLDEDESDYEGSASSEDDEFKVKTTPKSAAKPKKQSPPSSAKSVKKEVKPVKGAEGRKTESKIKLVPAKRQPAKKDAAQKGEGSPQKKRKKEEEQREVWKWWEEERLPDGVKWRTLEHSGPAFPPPYQPLPKDVKFYYDGQAMALVPAAEEVAGFFAKMLDHEYTSKEIFVKNFWNDWRKVMTPEEAKVIRDFKKCDFTAMHRYFKECSEARKQLSKEEKLKIKEENERLVEEYGWTMIDGHRERIGNFKIEPPGLFRGRGDHPKQGMIKKRLQAEDITINVGKGAKVPTPPAGHKWKAVIHDSSVTWLASWTENVQGQIKYVMLNPTSRLKGEKDWMKYETARKLKGVVDQIRKQYGEDLKSKEMRIRQRATALYFIDKLALRAGNEKDTDEAADTVGCCSLRVEHITLHDTLGDQEFVVEFDFLGKDSIRYLNKVPVERQVFKNLKLFVKGKQPEDDLFDRLNTSVLNKHLQDLMEGLTAKVFRTFNASNTLQEQLDQLTHAKDSTPAQLLSYNRANRAVAVLCNHQRTAPKAFQQQMDNLQKKIDAKRDALADVEKELKVAKREAKGGDAKAEKKLETVRRKQERTKEQLYKLEVQATDKEENKEIALGTSKLNYLDPRISVSWCKKWDIPVEKVYNKTQRQKFAWAIDMADETFAF